MTSPILGSAPCSPLCEAAYARFISKFPLLSHVPQGGGGCRPTQDVAMATAAARAIFLPETHARLLFSVGSNRVGSARTRQSPRVSCAHQYHNMGGASVEKRQELTLSDRCTP